MRGSGETVVWFKQKKTKRVKRGRLSCKRGQMRTKYRGKLGCHRKSYNWVIKQR